MAAGFLAVVLSLGVGVAYAAVFFAGSITGSSSVVAAPKITWIEGFEAVTTDGTGIECTPMVAGDALNLTISSALPGASCSVLSKFQVSPGTADLVFQNIDLGPRLMVDMMEGAKTNHLTCGELVERTEGNPNGNFVKMKITVPADAKEGTLAFPENAGLTLVPQAQYDPALCTAGAGNE